MRVTRIFGNARAAREQTEYPVIDATHLKIHGTAAKLGETGYVPRVACLMKQAGRSDRRPFFTGGRTRYGRASKAIVAMIPIGCVRRWPPNEMEPAQ